MGALPLDGTAEKNGGDAMKKTPCPDCAARAAAEKTPDRLFARIIRCELCDAPYISEWITAPQPWREIFDRAAFTKAAGATKSSWFSRGRPCLASLKYVVEHYPVEKSFIAYGMRGRFSMLAIDGFITTDADRRWIPTAEGIRHYEATL